MRKLIDYVKSLKEWKQWLLIMLVVWFFSILIIIYVPIEDTDQDKTKYLYLLSALAQSLSAISALVFTISLIVAQLSARYSYRVLSSYFDNITISYICLFIISISLSFWGLTNLQSFTIKFSMIIAALALYGLIPYFLRFKDQLNPIFSVYTLREMAERKILKDTMNVPDEISTIDNYIMSAFALKDYDTYNAGINSLDALLINILDKRGKSETEESDSENDNLEILFTVIIRRLRDIGITTIDDPRAPFSAIGSISRNATRCSLYRLDDYGRIACDCLGTIGIQAAKKGLPDLLINPIMGGVVNKFIHIGNTAVKSNMGVSVLYTGKNLASIGKEAAHNKLSAVSYAASDIIHRLINESMDLNLVIPNSKIDICSVLTYELGGIGFETIENSQQETTHSIAEFICSIGSKAISNNFELTSQKALEAIKIISMKSCEKELENVLRWIPKILYKIGLVSLDNDHENNMISTVDTLTLVSVKLYEKGDTGNVCITNSVKYLIQLGVESRLRRNDNLEKLIAERLKILRSKYGLHQVDIGFSQLETEFSKQPVKLDAVIKFKDTCNR